MINGETLQRLRSLKGLTKKKAAIKLGISPSAYTKLEQSPWLEGDQLHIILSAFGCSMSDLEKVMALLN